MSDAFCVDRYRAEFLDLIRKGTVDIVFANERELHSLYETADFDTAVKALRGEAKLAVVTRSEKGCVVVSRDAVEAVQAEPVEQVVDVTGAGDLFAAGFLVGLARGKDHRTAARLGALGRRRSHPAYRRTAGGVAEGACRRKRPAGLTGVFWIMKELRETPGQSPGHLTLTGRRPVRRRGRRARS